MRAHQNDPDAWERLFHLYGPLVYGWARQAELQPQDASDMVQEVFKSVLLSFDSFNMESFRQWLWVITRNHLYNWHRKQKPAHMLSNGATEEPNSQDSENFPNLLNHDFDPDEERSKSILLKRALEMIESDFEPETWKAFWELSINKKPVNVISKELNMSAGAVRQAKYRILLRLREEIGRL
ncbi:sigma-70 family RNA polymerase sigma factor [Planctomycetaceae bacterium]|jgi:RNA polymerase sigma-70 factor, ECF subfamily|nr:sigma-70 family RNA polymerase sigma factor [bacterium]MDC0273096.1 sigma-70 family RNA polymerase sigma factor [Planctomycetaceae bacterium]